MVIVCDNPELHSGFATVGREVARSLHARGVQVRYVARYLREAGAPAEPYEVLEIDLADEPARSRLTRSLSRAVRASGPARRVALLSIGALPDHADLLAALGEIRPSRPDVVILYLPVDSAPLPPIARATLSQADILVPYTSFGAEAIRRAGVTAMVAPPIPHGVDTGIFAPLEPDERRAVRRDRFELADDELLVSFFGRNCGHKRPDLALRIFAAWANGGVASCPACATLVELPLDPVVGGYGTLRRCPHCGAEGAFARQPTRSDARLYMHTELLTSRQRRISGGWDLERMAHRLGIHDRVLFDPSLQVGRGVDGSELARRMAACDVHLLPYEGGAWELTVLETAACGVPNVITDAAAPPEYAAPFSVLVPPMMRVHGPAGARALIDVGRAVAAMQRLASNREERRRLGQRGIEVARAHQWDRIGDDWLELLRSDPGQTDGAARASRR